MASSDLHKDHRKRMRDRFKQNGISAFEDHELLEMLLFSFLPRRNTNPIAHRLLDEFGDIQSVLSAERQELCRIDGIGESAAEQLKFIGELFSDITPRLFANIPLDTEDKIGMYSVLQMGTAPAGSAVAVYLDERDLIIDLHWLYRGKSEMTDGIHDFVCERAKKMHSSSVILIHNHRKEPLEASPEDTVITERLRRSAVKLKLKKIWHVITSEEGYMHI